MSEENYFFVPPEGIADGKFILPEEEKYHASKVLRKMAGDEIWILDGQGCAYRGLISDVKHGLVTGTILESIPGYGEPDRKVHLGIGILKKDKLEWVVEKSTELGVNGITFLLLDHCVKKEANIDRLERIIRSAVKQCGRSQEPRITGPVSLIDWLEIVGSWADKHLICNPGGKNIMELSKSLPEKISVLVGPEGGFSQNELYLAGQSEFLTLNLGKRRLRAETAAVAACSQLLAF